MDSSTELAQDLRNENLNENLEQVIKQSPVDNLKNASVKTKRVNFLFESEEKNVKLNTLQNIYDSNSQSKTDNLARSNSIRNRINKDDYIKLHRQNVIPIRNSSVDKLKGKYESIFKQADNDLKLNTGVRIKVNSDNSSTNKGTTIVSKEEEKQANQNINLKTESTNLDDDTSTVTNSSSCETIVKVEQSEQEPNNSDYLIRTQSNIEKLQNNLSSRLSNETIERLKYRYSPASFGYSGKKKLPVPKRNSAEELSTKIPVPTPRTSLNNISSSTEKIESVTVKLISVDIHETSILSDIKLETPTIKDENSNLLPKTSIPVKSEPPPLKPNDSEVPVTESEAPQFPVATSGVPQVPVAKLEVPQVFVAKSEVPQVPVAKPTEVTSSVVPDVISSTPIELDVTYSNIEFAEPEEKHFIVRRSSSEDSINQVEHFLSEIIMEKRPKEKKRSNSFKRLAAGIFGRDKKKIEGDKSKHKHKKDNEVFSDNAQNESQTFDRNSSHRHTVDNSFSRLEIQRKNSYPHNLSSPTYEQFPRFTENRNSPGRYTEMKGSNITSFKPNPTRQQLGHHYGEDYVQMGNGNLENSRNVQTTYMNINKYADTSSSSSNTLDSDRNCTYQNALVAQAEMRQHNENLRLAKLSNAKSPNNRFVNYSKYENSPENYRHNEPNNLQLVKPKAHIPINSERPLPNPYHNNHDSPEKYDTDSSETLDRNLNVENKKTHVLKNNLYGKTNGEEVSKVNNSAVVVDDIYGTVFDSIVPRRTVQKHSLPQNPTPEPSQNSSSTCSSPTYRSQTSPKSLESSKLKLPSNREKIDLQPRIRSPIPQVKVSTDKIIATELLRNKKSPSRESSSLEELKIRSSPVLLPKSLQVPSPNQHFLRKQQQEKKFALPNAGNLDQIEAKSEFVYLNLEPKNNQAPQEEVQLRQRHINVSPVMGITNVTTSAMIHATPEEKARRNYGSLPGRRAPHPQQMYYTPEKPPLAGSLNSSLNNVRAQTPQQLPPSPTPKSPEKQHIINNVEAFYWRELKKLKEREEEELARYRQHQLNVYGYIEDPVVTRRSRSVSPSLRRAQRSLSLPRDVRPNVPQQSRVSAPNLRRDGSPMMYHARNLVNGHEVILEGRPLIAKQPIALPVDSTYGQVRQQSMQRNQPFVRNAYERTTIGPIGMSKDSRTGHEKSSQDFKQIYGPIFKRGSLTGNGNSPDSQMLKKVSFSNNANSNIAVWPTKNGFTRSPPTRRIEKELAMDDEVFLPNSPKLPGNAGAMHSSPRLQQEQIYQNQAGYYIRAAPSVVDYGGRRKMQELPQHEAESLYVRTSPKQVTVSNRVCDIYGRIHDSEQKQANERALAASRNYGQVKQVGLVYGHLQQPRNPENDVVLRQSYNQLNSPESNFVRGTRLTASVNDMYKRYPSDNSHYGVQQRRPNQNEGIYSSDRNTQAPFRPLPPIPRQQDSRLPQMRKIVRGNPNVSSAESGSESGEVQRIFKSGTKERNFNIIEEEWNSDGKLGRGSGNESGGSRGDNEGEIKSSRSRSARREDPRRHTLSGDQHYGMAGQGGPLSRTMDLEGQFVRGYPPSSNAMLFDDDPGIMSEVETSSTGFRRGGKQRSSLPVVRTPSKTLERPLGLVFLQYRNETKRALLPNEITSIDTVKALFVRSFPKQLSMEYLDSPLVKIYIHDSSKDMFYELEDIRSHLREIRDRSVLRLFESTDVSGGLPMGGVGIPGGVGHFEDPSYFSEPEFDSEYQHQHIHKSKGTAGKSAPYYMGSTSSLPRGAALLRPYSPAVNTLPSDRMKTLPAGAPPKPQRAYSSGATRASDGSSRPPDRFAPFQRPANPLFNLPDGYMSSPERGSRGYEDPYYSQYTSRSGSITPVIDEEISDTELLDEQYSLYGVKIAPGGPRNVRGQFPGPGAPPYDATRLRVEHMERQLANLTGLVQKALTQTPPTRDFLAPPGRDAYRSGDEFDKHSSSSSASIQDDSYLRSDSIKAPKLGKSCHKSVSFEKSVSFSDEPPDMNSPKQHSPQHTADTKPPKPAIKSSTLPRTSSQEKDRLKPAPPPKPASLSPGQYDGRHIYRDLQLTPEMYNQLRGLQKKAKDLRAEVRNLRRMSQAQAHSVRETIRDTFIKIRAMLVAGGEQVWQAGMDQERVRLSRDEDLYKQEMLRLEKDLTDLESSVEELRGNVINRKTRVNMSDVENMALVLSKSSKTVADLKLRFPGLQDSMKTFLTTEMDKVVREEKFLKEEPERLESALRRCKKLTGTLVTLKRLASVQEQRLPNATGTPEGRISPTTTETPPVTPTSAQHSKPPSGARLGQVSFGGDSANSTDSSQRPENALDALLDELQTFSKPHSATVNTQMPQASYSDSTPSDPPAIPVKGIPPSHSSHFPHMSEIGRKGSMDSASLLPTQNLTVSTATGSLRRLHSYPSGSDTDNSPPIQPPRSIEGKSFSKPPIPERNAELLQHVTGRRVPPPPPPRTSSKSPLASPTSPSLPPRSPATGLQHIQNVQNMTEKPMSQFEAATQNLGLSTLRRNVPNRSSIKDNKAQTLPRNIGSNLQIHTEQVAPTGSELQNVSSSSCESVNSQDGTKKGTRKEELEQRHQELLKKQKALQEQYARLQQLQRGNNTLVAVVPPAPDQLLKKTGSESNLLQKMGLQMATTQMTGSLTNLPSTTTNSTNMTTPTTAVTTDANTTDNSTGSSTTTTNKVYETDIL